MKALQLIKGRTLPVFLLCVLIGLNWSCKENSILPKNLVPGVDNLNTFDTSFQVITHTLYQDSFPTGGRKGDVRLSINSNLYSACGSIQADPVFGSTFASMHVEVLPAIPNFTFKAPTADMIIDSVVLSLPYKMAYGDTGFSSIKQKFRVFRSVKAFPRDSAQYEFTRDSIDENNLLSTLDVNFNTLPSDSPVVAGVRQQPQLRFKLASWFVDSVKAQVDLGATGALGSFTSFLDWWKGFAIVPANSKGNTLGYFETFRARLTFYYRYPKAGGGEEIVNDVFSFDPNYCNRFCTIDRQYAGGQVTPYINTKKPGGDSLIFLQNEPGLVGLLHMPEIARMENVIVNRAELVFTLAPSQQFFDTLTYGLLPRLQIFKTDSIGENDKIAEDYAAFNSSNYVDGKRYPVVINGSNYVQYKFTITNSIQRMLSQSDSLSRYKIMGANTGLPAAYRGILSGSASQLPEFRPQLNVIYTRLNKQ